jgi:Na+-transporting methylmalonyl-CoA/oxaloacetate decarboxylase beta subunit
MRFLKTLTLNRRAIYDIRVALTISNDLTLADSRTMILPNSQTTITIPVLGQMRYNTSSNQVEVYQGVGGGATWRSLRYKEATQITTETYTGDGASTVFGPLSTQPPTVVESGSTWTASNLIVVVGNVFQVATTNYLVQTGTAIGTVGGTDYSTGPDASKYYIKFTSASPGLSTPIVILHGFTQ